MQSKMKVSRSVIPRLSVYYRALISYGRDGVISSDKLSELTRYTAAQIRKDLAYFGQFGTPGKGYVTGGLKNKILEILGIDKQWNVALVGVGNLGTAVGRSDKYRPLNRARKTRPFYWKKDVT